MVGTIGRRLQSREFQACAWVLAAGTGIGAIATIFSSSPAVVLALAAIAALATAFPVSSWTEAERVSLEAERRELREQVRELEGAVDEANDLADQAHAARGQFLAAMNHELRTPLNAIIGFAQLLEMQGLSDEHRDSVRPILRSGRQLLGLVNELLQISQIETNRLELSPEPVLIRALVGEVMDLMLPAAAHRL